jgi:Na+/H+ antiporter NhaD/arsenite permease-like protein
MLWPGLIFSATYVGVALGRIPGLTLDRTGIALLGAIAMIEAGTMSFSQAVDAVDLPTILLLYALMVVSAQLKLSGFYTHIARLVSAFLIRPRTFLFVCMLTGAVLSAVLANDIICLAFTPVLAVALQSSRRSPVPYLLGLAVASNIGSAATIIGNPQNMLIGQVGRLAFDRFFLWSAPPALASLLLAYLVLCALYRTDFDRRLEIPDVSATVQGFPRYVPWQSRKGLLVVGVLLVCFLTPLPRESCAIAAAGVLLCSRKMKSRQILESVDWHLITLFCGLFIIVHGIEIAGIPNRLMEILQTAGVDVRDLYVLSGISAVTSNLFSNVPAAMLLLKFLDPGRPDQWYALAVSSTFAGNLITIGSIANLIVIEQAAACGIRISFGEHARVGVPVTLASFGVLAVWIGV